MASSLSSSSAAAAAPTPQTDEDMLLDITDINARVLLEDDALLTLGPSGMSTEPGANAAAAAAGGGAGGPGVLVGIWPELAIMQHSCCPNASVVAHKVIDII
jgi:hypothetical protein